MFDGKAKAAREVNYGGKRTVSDSKVLMENARKQREARALERARNAAAVKVQKIVKSKLSRSRIFAYFRGAFDSKLADLAVLSSTAATSSPHGQLESLMQLLPIFFDPRRDLNRQMSVIKLLMSVLPVVSLPLPYLSKPLGHPESRFIYLLYRIATLAIDQLLSAASPHIAAADYELLLTFLTALELRDANPNLGIALALVLIPHTTSSLSLLCCNGGSGSSREDINRQWLKDILLRSVERALYCTQPQVGGNAPLQQQQTICFHFYRQVSATVSDLLAGKNVNRILPNADHILYCNLLRFIVLFTECRAVCRSQSVCKGGSSVC